MSELRFRTALSAGDREAVARIVGATGFFNPAEEAIAVELVDERWARGPKSGYEFVFAERAGAVVGYTCWGHIDGSERSYDLYWIAVDPACQTGGIGRALWLRTAQEVARLGGGLVWAETSGRDLYEPTRAFYRALGFVEEARLRDFYAPGDDKVFFVAAVAAG